MSDGPTIVGQAILRDYPLRIWHRQYEHNRDLIREFQLIVAGGEQPQVDDVPHRLLDMAEMFITRFAAQMDVINRQRQDAFDAGLMTIDSVVPLPAETMEIIPAAMAMLREVDDYCRSGELLTLATPADVAALLAWSTGEMMAQFQGAEPTPWDGPLE